LKFYSLKKKSMSKDTINFSFKDIEPDLTT
jgi:hypothetical protein